MSAANEKMIVKRGYSSRTDPKKCSSQKNSSYFIMTPSDGLMKMVVI